MTEDKLELEILKKYVAQHEAASIANPQMQNKCARELDMREVLRDLLGYEEPLLKYHADLWLQRLAPSIPGSPKGPLRRCSNAHINMSTHVYHARAYTDPLQKITAPAWERIRELESKIAQQIPETPRGELDQKFKILYSESQAQKDFKEWLSEATKNQYPIAILFLDIDHFKNLNTKYTETKVDETILPEVQHLLKQLISQRGRAYRYGGEEFLVILPNHNTDEAMLYGERLRIAFETHNFDIDGLKEKLTISVGISLWPHHGKEYKEVLNAANIAEHKAKNSGRNSIVLAQYT